jgi:ribose transport system substrate-binding protein
MIVRRTMLGLAAATMLAPTTGAALAAEKIALITPYLAQPGTQFYVEAFQAKAKEFGWEVNVIDTKGLQQS